jgi:hypothetical protein
MAKKVNLEIAAELRAEYQNLQQTWHAEYERRMVAANDAAIRYVATHKQMAKEAIAEARKYKRKIAELDALLAAQAATT